MIRTICAGWALKYWNWLGNFEYNRAYECNPLPNHLYPFAKWIIPVGALWLTGLTKVTGIVMDVAKVRQSLQEQGTHKKCQYIYIHSIYIYIHSIYIYTQYINIYIYTVYKYIYIYSIYIYIVIYIWLYIYIVIYIYPFLVTCIQRYPTFKSFRRLRKWSQRFPERKCTSWLLGTSDTTCPRPTCWCPDANGQFPTVIA